MTAISANLEVPVADGVLTDHALLADQIVYEGTPVFADASSGYAQTNDGSTITLAQGDVFLGICEEKQDSTGLSSGAVRVKTRTKGVFEMVIGGTVTQAKVGDPVYVNNTTDNSTVTLTAAGDGSDCLIGYLVDYVSATKGKVMITGAGRNLVGSNYDPASSGLFGTSALLVGKMEYSFAIDGGAQADFAPATTCVIPSGAIVYQAITNVIAACTGVGATVAVHLQSANDIHTAAAISGAPWSTTGLKAATPVGTAATAILLTADRTAKVVIGTADLTAGHFVTYFLYMLA